MTRSRSITPRCAPAALALLLAMGCGHDESYYIRQVGRLRSERGLRDRAILAAAMDARNAKAKLMLDELGESTRRHTAKIEERLRSKSHLPADQDFEEELAYFNEQNRIIRAYGFGQYTAEFKAD